MSNRNIEVMFSDVLPLIKDESLRKSLILILDKYIPEYWFHDGASSTGKYHPEYASGEGGLMRHSKSAMMFGDIILGNPLFGDKYTARQKDLLLIALLIHDGLKYGYEKVNFTRFDHPILMSEFLKEKHDELGLTEEDASYMARVIASHMGPWNTNKYDKAVLPIPETEEEKIVHLCDYLASRKSIGVGFDTDSLIKYSN